jgi:hypothetical protein
MELFIKVCGKEYIKTVRSILEKAGIRYDVDQERADIWTFLVNPSDLAKAKQAYEQHYNLSS